MRIRENILTDLFSDGVVMKAIVVFFNYLAVFEAAGKVAADI